MMNQTFCTNLVVIKKPVAEGFLEVRYRFTGFQVRWQRVPGGHSSIVKGSLASCSSEKRYLWFVRISSIMTGYLTAFDELVD